MHQSHLAEGEEAADFIKTFVVQAKLNERGNFGEHFASCPQCAVMHTWELHTWALDSQA